MKFLLVVRLRTALQQELGVGVYSVLRMDDWRGSSRLDMTVDFAYLFLLALLVRLLV